VVGLVWSIGPSVPCAGADVIAIVCGWEFGSMHVIPIVAGVF
jgi:hypothetical protein